MLLISPDPTFGIYQNSEGPTSVPVTDTGLNLTPTLNLLIF